MAEIRSVKYGWEQKPVSFRIVGKNLCIASPIQGGIDLALHIFLGKMLVQHVAKEFQWESSV